MTKSSYLVRGDDVVLVSDAIRALVASLVGESDPSLSVEEFDLAIADDNRVAAVLDACLTPPFLTEHRIVIARSAGALNVDEGGRLVRYLENPLRTTVLVLVGGGGTVPPKLLAAIRSVGEIIDAGAPRQARERSSWFAERLRSAPVHLEPEAAQRLGDHLGEDVARLRGILDVLGGAFGEGATITLDQLEPFLGEAGGVAPWELTGVIDKADAGSALELLHRMVTGGDRHPLVVMATLHRHFDQMLRLDGSGARNEAEAAAVLGLKGSTFPARKALAQARKLGSGRIRRAIALLAEADLDLRGQKTWSETLVMEVLVARLCQLSRV